MENKGDSDKNTSESVRSELLKKAKELTPSPGVYQMKDENDSILYVGKAKSLKSRVSSYFQAAAKPSPRTEMLVGRVVDFEVIITETESEALILENTLIKKLKPKFNVRLKDDKTYPYIKISESDDFPKIGYVRRVKSDGARYFGPFASAWSARQVMQLLNQTYKLRDCSDNTFRHRSRACILYEMDRCTAPCVEKISQEDYLADIREAIRVLEGKGDVLIQNLRKAMESAADEEEYELAAEFRDQLKNLELVTETQAVVQAGKDKNWDVIGIAKESSDIQAAILQMRNGKVIGAKQYYFQNGDESLDDEQILYDLLTQHYLHKSKPEVNDSHPTDVLVHVAPEDCDLLEKTLSISLRVPENPTDKQLIQVANSNAIHSLGISKRRNAGHGLEALEEIQDKLKLNRVPQKIECYDISNIHGQNAVASRVVFVDGAPEKELYRRYKIKTVQGSNDFAMMKEVLGRRFARSEDRFPDLVVVDGGKGQLSQAVSILDELGVQGVYTCGLAKARTKRDFKEKEVESSQERVFIPNRKNPIPLYPTTKGYRLLTHIRDEAHRFAITYHRQVRSKERIKS